MTLATNAGDAHLREALKHYRAEETARVAAFERDIALLRERIKTLEMWLSNSAIAATSPDAARDTEALGDALPDWRQARSPVSVLPTPQRWARMLQGMTQTEALLRIAEEYGGQFRATDAKQIFLAAKLVRGNPKNTLGHIYHLLGASERFEKIAPGTFRLVPLGDEGSALAELSVAENGRHAPLALPVQVSEGIDSA